MIREDGFDVMKTSVYKGYKQDKIEMRGDRAEMSEDVYKRQVIEVINSFS